MMTAATINRCLVVCILLVIGWEQITESMPQFGLERQAFPCFLQTI